MLMASSPLKLIRKDFIMPCMGPNINQKQLHEAYAEIRKLLADKYDIQKYEVSNILPLLMRARAEAFRAAYNEQLREVLEHLFMQQECEDF
jgi:hypothetical protein